MSSTRPAGHTAPASELRAVLVALTGSCLVGSVPMLATGLYKGGMDAASLLFWRYWIALIVLIPLAAWTSPSLREDWSRAGWALFLNAVTFGALQTFTYFRAVESLPSSVVVTIFFSYPILALLLDRVVFSKRAGWGSIVAVILVFFGAMLTGWPSLSVAGADPVAIACAIATPIGFSIYLAISYPFTRRSSPFAGGATIYFGLAVAYTIAALLFGLKMPHDGAGWARMAFIGTVGGAVQICSFAYALPRLSASGYSVVVSIELVTVVILGVVVLGEQLSLLQGAGIALVTLGVIGDRVMRMRAQSRGG